jgi:hypothetical protein
MMKTLKFVVALVLLVLIVPVMAQDYNTDSYAYQGSTGCQVKILITTGKIKNSINYRLTYQGAQDVTGTVDASETEYLLLPVTRQWYQLFVERAEVDKELYTVESTGCDGSERKGVTAAAPILTEDAWANAQSKLKSFLEQIHSN